MEEWKEYMIGDICKIKHGFAFKGCYFVDEPQRYVCVTPGNFSLKGGFKNDKPKYYNGPIPENYILKEEDLIVTMTDLSKAGDTLGYSALVPKDDKHIFLHNQRIGLIENLSPNIEKHFLYWIMRTYDYQSYVVGHCSGSTVKHTSPTNIGSYSFKAPSIELQRVIVSILDNLDDKIEVNRRINENLEQQAKALFKSWFVDFEPFKNGEFVESELGMIPKGWRVERVENLALKMASGGTPKSLNKDYYSGDIKWFSTKELKDCFLFDSEKHISEDALNNSSAKMFPEGTVLMAIYAAPTVGRLGILTNPATFNQAAVGIVPKENVGSEFIYMSLLSERINLNNLASGAAQQNLNVSIVKNYNILVPEQKVLDGFNRIAKSYFTLLKRNASESRRLAELRDTLLPKLMSGELKVNEVY